MVTPLCRHGLAMVDPVLHGPAMASPWRVHRGFVVAPWAVAPVLHGSTMVSPWCVHGGSMVAPSTHHERALPTSWRLPEDTMATPWWLRGNSMPTPWRRYGVAMVPPVRHDPAMVST